MESNLKESILEEAQRLITGERHEDYGDASIEFERIAVGWGIIINTNVSEKQVALMMIWLKTCREIAKDKRDNWVDMAGYAGLGGELP